MGVYICYRDYLDCIREQLAQAHLTFKGDQRYQGILEHVSFEFGQQYLKCLTDELGIAVEEIQAFVRLNDRIGCPKTFFFAELQQRCSPTSLRYIYHAHLILKRLKGLPSPIDLVEIGAGYGGLCLALYHFACKQGVTINSYTMIDLTEASKLQQRYLASKDFADTLGSVAFLDAKHFGQDFDRTSAFLVSNYSFSEITDDLRRQYIRHLFPKVEHGFLAWNIIPLFDFGKPILGIEPETPLTGPNNFYVYF